MKFIFYSLLPGIIAFSTLTTDLYATQFVVAVTDYRPYGITENNAKTGIFIDILNQIGKKTGDTFVFKHIPAARVKLYFVLGKIDIESGVNPVWRADQKIIGEYTIPFMKSVDVVLFRKGHRIPVKKFDDLKGWTIGTVRGYYYPGFMEAFKKKEIIREDVNTEFQNLNKIAFNRLNAIFINRVVAEYWMSKNSTYHNFEIGEVVGSTDIMFRIHPSKKEAIPRLNKAILNLKQTRSIDQIFSKYR